MITIPNRETKTLVQVNRGKVFGDLWATFNIDLQDSPGIIKLGNRLKTTTTTSDDADLGLPVAFKHFDDRFWTIAGAKIFKNTGSVSSAFVEDSSSGVATDYNEDYSDLEVFNDLLVGVTDDSVYSKVSNGSGTGAWTARSTALSSSYHKLLYFKKFDRLYVTDSETKIKSVDTSGWTFTTSGDYYIDLGNTVGSISTIAATSERIWIGTVRNSNSASAQDATSRAVILEWDGISNQVTKEYPIDAQGVLAIVIKDGVPIIMDSNGILRQFSGYSFDEIGRLPVGDRGLLYRATVSNIPKFIHPNGLAVNRNGNILALINNRNSDSSSINSINENLPSGIWEYSKTNGFIHKHSFSYMPVGSTTVTDYGQNRISQAGALMYAGYYDTSAVGRSTILCGAEYFTDATSTTNGVFVDARFITDGTNTDGQRFGYLTSTWKWSRGFKDTWQKLAVKYRELLTSSDRITLKYRTREETAISASITWLNETTFHTTTDVSGLEGYEVEITQGTGSGKCVHIQTIQSSAPWRVTIDESVAGVTTGTAKVRIQNWKKAFQVSDQITESTFKTLNRVVSERIQLKCCMQFTGENELHEVGIISEENQPM
jgi:hypothetical protein